MSEDRTVVLGDPARRILAVERPHPVRTAVDGPNAAGKTTLAEELAVLIAAAGRPVSRASIDGFRRPSAARHRRRRDDPDGDRLDRLDRLALIRLLLAPLGTGGHRRYRTRIFDVAADAPVQTRLPVAPAQAVRVVDGVLLLSGGLRQQWDVSVFISVQPETVLRRALAPDVPRLARYRARFLPAQARYMEQERPLAAADIVVKNDDPARPRLLTARRANAQA